MPTAGELMSPVFFVLLKGMKFEFLPLLNYNISRGENMELSVLNIQESRIKLLNKKGFESVEDVQEFFPRTYYDFLTPRVLVPALNEKYCAIIGTLTEVSTKKTNDTLMVKCAVHDQNNRKLNVMLIGQYFRYNIIKDWKDLTVIVGGKLTYSEEYHSFHMNNPIVFEKDIPRFQKIYPVYTKMARISEEYMNSLIKESLSLPIADQIPKEIAASHNLISRKEALFELHNPTSFERLHRAKQRITFDKLLSFAISMEQDERRVSKGTIYNIKSTAVTDDFIKSLPYKLTSSQKVFYESCRDTGINGLRINALLQGDVGSGKTISAILLMLMMVESGYQAAIMAPTTVLAKQHFEEVKKAADKYGYKVALLAGKQTKKEKKDIYAGIASGMYQFVVGTHAILSENISFKNLAVTVCDEEHRFGVNQRNILTSKAVTGTHTVAMSATPIPRTMTSILYGSNIRVYDLELPAERKETKTCVYSSQSGIFKFLEKEILAKGEQAYVVCPYISTDDEETEVSTVEETYSVYSDHFGKEKVSVITGKMDSEEIEDVITRFKQNKFGILISTTIIEVGVSVKNANCIIIRNAENFGLAQLHQLRGRVGRGSSQGYCILESEDKDNPRLTTMCQTTNGFKIAEEDLKLRGGGNLLGTEQSGKNELLELLSTYPKMYEIAKNDAKVIVNQIKYA